MGEIRRLENLNLGRTTLTTSVFTIAGIKPGHGQFERRRQMKIRKLYHPKTLRFCLELWIGWRSLKLTGFWFTDRIGNK